VCSLNDASSTPRSTIQNQNCQFFSKNKEASIRSRIKNNLAMLAGISFLSPSYAPPIYFYIIPKRLLDRPTRFFLRIDCRGGYKIHKQVDIFLHTI
jgi:hypothetical protein